MLFDDKRFESLSDTALESEENLSGPERIARGIGALAAATGVWVAPQIMHYDAHDSMAPVPITVAILGVAALGFAYETITGRNLNSQGSE